MKKYIKFSALSLSILAGIAMESHADMGKPDIYSADGSFTTKHSTIQDQKELPPMAEYALSGLKIASMPVESIARYAVAYNASYYCIEGIKEATALGLYGVTYLTGTYAAGPVLGSQAANFVYHGTKAAFGTMDLILPAYNGALAVLYVPLVKPVTNIAIDYAPTALKMAYSGASSLVSTGVSLVSSLGSAFSSWYSPTESISNFNFSGSSIERMFS